MTITSIERVEAVPDPETTFPLNELIKATRIIVSETRGRVFVNGRSDQGPVALAMALCGPENFLIAAMNPKLKSHIHKLLDICTRMNVALGEAQRRAGAVYEVLTPICNMSHSAG